MSSFVLNYVLCAIVFLAITAPLHAISEHRIQDIINVLTKKSDGIRNERLEAANTGKLPQSSGRRRDWDTAEGNIFRAFWDVPGTCSTAHGIDIPLSDFGIEFNSNHDWFHGSAYHVYSALDLGNYPFVNRVTQQFVNGGLPQLGNITAHLEKAAADILATIPDAKFDGIGMIDWEAWHPQWDSIEKRYQTMSIDHVRKNHPGWDAKTTSLVAKLEWTQGAKLFMESTLKLAKQLRPNMVWGFYHYPYCGKLAAGQDSCPSYSIESNDEIMWLFNESTAIYPSIYLGSAEVFADIVEAELKEAFRLRDLSSDPKGVVLSYTRFNYSKTDYYFSYEDLNNTILKSAEFGTHGVVFWGDHYDGHTLQTCLELKDYVIKALGPTVVMAREGAQTCSKRVCSGHGRCVGKILSCTSVQVYKNKSKVKSEMCSCRCFRGWKGLDCSEETTD